MQGIFNASVKFYSTYSELIPAPRGFETAVAPLDSQKWQHFPTEINSSLILDVGTNRTCYINVVWKGRTMETVRVNLLDTAKTVQFTARCPAISCKYIIWTEAGMFMRRFQVSLSHDEDYTRLQLVLSGLKLMVKPARPQMPASNETKSYNSHAGTAAGHTKSTLPSNPLAANLRTDVTFTEYPILDSQFQTTAVEQSFQYPLYSQVMTESPWQSRAAPSFEKAPNPHVSDTLDAYPPTSPKPPMRKPRGLVTASPANELSLNCKQPFDGQVGWETQENTNDPYESMKTDVGIPNMLVHSTSKPSQENTGNFVCEIPLQLVKKAEVGLGQRQQEMNDQPPKQKDLIIEKGEQQISNNVCWTPGFGPEINVLDAKCNIPSETSSKNNGPKAPAINLRKQRNAKTEQKACDHSPESKSRVQCQKIRITKKMIKERLKDEYFMKWVSKVEEALSAMADMT